MCKKIKRDIDNWAETTTIAKNINVENINDDNQINIPTRRIDCELISMKEMRERLGIPEEVKVQEIEQNTNKEEITQEVKEKEPLIIRYGYVKIIQIITILMEHITQILRHIKKLQLIGKLIHFMGECLKIMYMLFSIKRILN